MKPLSDEQKEKIWIEIDKLSSKTNYIYPGEKTVLMFAGERKISRKRARLILRNLEKAGVLASRKAYGIAGAPEVFYPVQDMNCDEIYVKLKDIEGTT